MSFSVRIACASTVVTVIGLALGGCGETEVPYKPKPAPSGVKATLPPVPNVAQRPLKSGDAYTVWGASYSLRSRVHRRDVAGKNISITGYIIKTNLAEAPACAVHKTGKADPEGCNAPVPAFWIADTADASEKDAIKVMGWASNFAQIFDAIKTYDKAEKAKKDEAPEAVQDELWAIPIPYPLPVKGAKVTVTGSYSTTFTKASSSTAADPIMGILTYEKLTYAEKPTEKATLPGMKD
ncbi:MAG: hypothetical protein OZ921_09580 [Sorangiineae bacterium]|nr:hypothetical protein [Polyangiaceae bacterium]MEB2322754.1 hypothetical protein [Sorangiineae bacterium]